MDQNIKSELKKGIVITFFAKYSNILIQLVTNVVLARLLSPEDYGIVAVINVFIVFFSLLSTVGLGEAIVQDQTIDRTDISNLFKISIGIALLLGFLFFFFSYVLAWFYDNPVYVKIGHLLVFAIITGALSVVPLAYLRKQQNFKVIGIIEVSSGLISGLITILLAFKGYNYYSLVWKSIIFNILCLIGYARFSGIYSILSIKVNGIVFTSFKRNLAYSSYQFFFNVINFFSRNLANILIGKYMNNIVLGLYNVSYNLMLLPIMNLTFVITPVLHPVLAQYQNNQKLIFEYYKKIVKLLAHLGIPVSLFCFFSAEEIISILYGDKWTQAVPFFKMLSASIWLQVINSSTGSIFQALGRTDYLFKVGVISTACIISAISLGLILNDIVFVCMGISFSYLLIVLITNFFLVHLLGFDNFFNFYKILVPPMANGVIIIVLLAILNINTGSNIFDLAVKGFIILFISVANIFLFAKKDFLMMKSLLLKST